MKKKKIKNKQIIVKLQKRKKKYWNKKNIKKKNLFKKEKFLIINIKRGLRLNQRLQVLLKQFIKKGNNKGFFFFINIIKYIKKEWKYLSKKPYENIPNIILKSKLLIILKNKRRGSVIYELPRCLSKKQNIRKAYYWFVKITKKRKKKTIKNLIIELKNIKKKKGALIKKRRLIKLTAKKNKPFFYLLKKRKKKKYKK